MLPRGTRSRGKPSSPDHGAVSTAQPAMRWRYRPYALVHVRQTFNIWARSRILSNDAWRAIEIGQYRFCSLSREFFFGWKNLKFTRDSWLRTNVNLRVRVQV